MKDNEKSKNILYSTNHQNVFCEHLVRFGLGPTISRLEFGSVNGLDTKDVVVEFSLRIPTSSLLSAIPALYRDLEEDSFKEQLVNDLKGIIVQLEKD
ncbi:MAG: hypothetical protein KA291_08680 [Psychrobacter sp.]|nr:hypothetical protein [Psychrobacter sp.]